MELVVVVGFFPQSSRLYRLPVDRWRGGAGYTSDGIRRSLSLSVNSR